MNKASGGDEIPSEAFQILKDNALKCCTSCASKFGKLSRGDITGKRSVFISVLKKGNAKEFSNYCTIVLISHASKVMLKFSMLGINKTKNFHTYKLDLEKAEEPEIKLPTSVGSSKKQESSRKTSTSALLTMPKPLTVWITTNCGISLKKIGIPDHLTCLLRNVYAGQEATVRTGHGTTDWFQIGKGVCQAYVLSPVYLTYIRGI